MHSSSPSASHGIVGAGGASTVVVISTGAVVGSVVGSVADSDVGGPGSTLPGVPPPVPSGGGSTAPGGGGIVVGVVPGRPPGFVAGGVVGVMCTMPTGSIEMPGTGVVVDGVEPSRT